MSVHRSSPRRDRALLEARSVLVDEARVAREPLWLRAEELAVLVDSEDVEVVSKLVSETPAFGRVFNLMLSLSNLPVNLVFLDLTAGDSLASGTVLLRVPGIRSAGGRGRIPPSVHAVVVRALIHDHRFSKDGIAAPERRPIGVLEIPPHVATCVAVERPEITDMVVVPTVVPAVRLTWRLQMLAGAAAVPVVPFPRIDGVAVGLAGVGHTVHLSPHEDRRAGVELDEVDLAVRISGPVGRVGLHPAVAARHLAVVWVLHAPDPPFVEGAVELCDS